MNDDAIQPGSEDVEHRLRTLVETVTALGERARLLSVQLAVATARVQQQNRGRSPETDNLLDLVARVTRITQTVNDAVAAVEKGLPQIRTSAPLIWEAWQAVGIPDEQTLRNLAASLDDATALAEEVFAWARTHKQESRTSTATPHGIRSLDDLTGRNPE